MSVISAGCISAGKIQFVKSNIKIPETNLTWLNSFNFNKEDVFTRADDIKNSFS